MFRHMNATKILWGQILSSSLVVLAFVWAATRMDGLAARLPAAARAALVRAVRLAGLSAARRSSGGGSPSTPMRPSLRRRRLHRGGRRLRRDRRGYRHVGLARARGQAASRPTARRAGRDPGDPARRPASATTACCSASWHGDYLRHDGPEHVLCFAPTRSGKGVGLVVPTLLTWPGSAIVHDIKGENWKLTAGWRARFGRVLLFDPTNARSAAYNPLLEVRRGEWEVRDVQNIADILVDPEGALERRNHWEKTSHSLLVGAILHVLYAEADKTLAGVANFLSDPKRPIEATLRAMMTTPHLGEAACIRSSPPRRASCSTRARTSARACCRPPCRSSGSIAIPSSRRVTRRCDWRIARPRRRRAAVHALPGRAALRHQPHQAAGPADPQPDRPAADRGARRRRTGGIGCC